MRDGFDRRRSAAGGARPIHVARIALAVLGTLIGVDAGSAEGRFDVSGEVAAEVRTFPETALSSEQHGDNLSLALMSKAYLEWDDRRQSLEIIPFLRLDQNDSQRSHFDIRELMWTYAADIGQLKLGIGKVFWGVTESRHLVDVVNQTDGVENPDGEDKLGQPLVNLTFIRPWGTVSAFVLPGFRQATYPGRSGRLRFPMPVHETAVFESADGDRHVDWALRWSQTLGSIDVGLSHFAGTSREPSFVPGADDRGRAVLVPHYDLVDQSGLDLLFATGSWLWKLEATSRSIRGARFQAATGGFEYTASAAFGSGADLGVLIEYLYDGRGNVAPTPFEDDWFLGARLAFNNVSGTDVLAGVIFDRSNGTNAVLVESGTRLTDGWKLEVEARGSFNADPADPLYGFRRDAYLQTTLTRYF